MLLKDFQNFVSFCDCRIHYNNKKKEKKK